MPVQHMKLLAFDKMTVDTSLAKGSRDCSEASRECEVALLAAATIPVYLLYMPRPLRLHDASTDRRTRDEAGGRVMRCG
ncbi:hypothetical protein JYU34_014746 [Plutella xylostella]|uniref:Uncharacterized protein n=1 Tax=Plutella xylostella TaxID=51655 RepID=A0ABQ7QA57_PLUXY|nr:hypothetical protein JYU34_014746 [Plutella xylostella]